MDNGTFSSLARNSIIIYNCVVVTSFVIHDTVTPCSDRCRNHVNRGSGYCVL